jgi:hypothetical protein
MTCVVGMVTEDGDVYMGADSAGVAGHSMYSRQDEKVFAKGEMLFGFTSSFRMGQLLRYKLNIPVHESGMGDYEYLVGHLIESVRECFRSGGYISEEEKRDVGGFFLLGYRKKLYHISTDFQVGARIEAYDAAGCGKDIALGSLFTSKKLGIGEPEVILNNALTAAATFSTGVKGPFHIIKMLSGEFTGGNNK